MRRKDVRRERLVQRRCAELRFVATDHVEEIRHWSSGEYRVELDDGTELKLTRTYRERILDRVIGK